MEKCFHDMEIRVSSLSRRHGMLVSGGQIQIERKEEREEEERKREEKKREENYGTLIPMSTVSTSTSH